MKKYKKYDGMNGLGITSYDSANTIPYFIPTEYFLTPRGLENNPENTPPYVNYEGIRTDHTNYGYTSTPLEFEMPGENIPYTNYEDLITPQSLTTAIAERNLDIVKLLIESGVDVTIKDIILAFSNFEEDETVPGMNSDNADIAKLCMENYKGDFKTLLFILLSSLSSFLFHNRRNSIIKFIKL